MFIVSAELNLIIVDKNEKVENLLARMSDTPNLKIMVVMETIAAETAAKAKQNNVQLIQYSDMEVSLLQENSWLYMLFLCSRTISYLPLQFFYNFY